MFNSKNANKLWTGGWLEGDSVPTAMSLSPEFCGFSVDWSMLPLRWVEFLDIFLSFVDATHKNSVDFLWIGECYP